MSITRDAAWNVMGIVCYKGSAVMGVEVRLLDGVCGAAQRCIL